MYTLVRNPIMKYYCIPMFDILVIYTNVALLYRLYIDVC